MAEKKNYADYSQDELIAELQKRDRAKRFGLIWEDKTEAVETRCKSEFPVLRELPEFAITQATGDLADTPADELPTHLLIEGDNYHSLSVLNYTHAGKIDVIYIDPPYNTGARDWKYDNNYVDKEDGYRHSKWLSFMNKRLRLAKNLLTDSGFVCCAIDHNELFNLGNLMDDIFGEENRAGVVTVVHNAKGRSDAQFFSVINEYILVYARNQEIAEMYNFELSEEKSATYSKEDDVGMYRLQSLMRTSSNSNRSDRPNMFFPIYYTETDKSFSLEKTGGAIEIFPMDPSGNEKCWRWGRDRMQNNIGELVYRKVNGRNTIHTKSRIENHPGEKARSVWVDPKYSNSTSGVQLRTLIGRDKFDYPKSIYAVLDFLKITSRPNSVILDFFAGSGTTGHAVSLLNKQDGGKRQFILCTNNENNNGNQDDPNEGIARGVCHPRIKAVIEGHEKLPDITGIPSNLKYFVTDFVEAGDNDYDKYQFTQKATEMLCVKENTFDELASVKDKHELLHYQLFQSYAQFTAIIFNDSANEQCKKAIINARKKYGDKPCTMYCFSIASRADESDFDGLDNLNFATIPEAIWNIYKRIFK